MMSLNVLKRFMSSKLIADDLNEATNDTLVNLLIEREKRIKTIQLIENERKSLEHI